MTSGAVLHQLTEVSTALMFRCKIVGICRNKEILKILVVIVMEFYRHILSTVSLRLLLFFIIRERVYVTSYSEFAMAVLTIR